MSLVVRRTAEGSLSVDRVEVPPPGPGEARIRHTAIGVNFIDAYFRQGLYPLPPDRVLGVEAAGVVEAVGAGVVEARVDDRVALAGPPVGAWAEHRNVPVARLLRLPDRLDDRHAAAVLLKGLTAHMLLVTTFAVGPGSLVLVHAAAGGLGQILTHWAVTLGARVVATVGSPHKAEIARRQGAELVVVGRDADWPSAIRRHFGRLVDVAYDGIGGAALRRTLDCVRPFGTVASIGQAAGPIAPLSVDEIGPRRSLCFARPSVMAYAADPTFYATGAAALFAMLESGWRPEIGAVHPLEDAASALAALERGETSGSILLVPALHSGRGIERIG